MGHDTLKFIIALAVLAILVTASALFASGYFPALGLGKKPVTSSTQSIVSGGTRHPHGALPSPSAAPSNMNAAGSVRQPRNYPAQPVYIPQPPVQIQETGYVPVQATGYLATPGTSPAVMPSTTPGQIEETTPQASFLSGWESRIEQLFQFLALIFHGSSSFLQEWSNLFKSPS